MPDDGVEAEFADILARLGGRSDRHRLSQQIDALTARAAAGELDEAGKTELKRLLAALK